MNYRSSFDFLETWYQFSLLNPKSCSSAKAAGGNSSALCVVVKKPYWFTNFKWASYWKFFGIDGCEQKNLRFVRLDGEQKVPVDSGLLMHEKGGTGRKLAPPFKVGTAKNARPATPVTAASRNPSINRNIRTQFYTNKFQQLVLFNLRYDLQWSK